jgi:hypothetical protein
VDANLLLLLLLLVRVNVHVLVCACASAAASSRASCYSRLSLAGAKVALDISAGEVLEWDRIARLMDFSAMLLTPGVELCIIFCDQLPSTPLQYCKYCAFLFMLDGILVFCCCTGKHGDINTDALTTVVSGTETDARCD